MTRKLGWILAVALAACGGDGGAGGEAAAGADTLGGEPLDSTDALATVRGLEHPEAVRYDPDQDIWFIANFGVGDEDPRDADGSISRVGADGAMEALRFMTGTDAHPLHMPRGMFLKGDTLWVADVDGVHGFHRREGRHLAFIDFRALEPGFLNDIAAGPDGTLYVTDTGRARVYRVAGAGATPEVVVDSLPAPPNGIAWDPGRRAFLLAPWGDGRVVRSLTPGGVVDSVVTIPSGRIDGIEVVAGGILVAAQNDSSLWLVEQGVPRRIVRTPGRPADIGYDPGRDRVAVPYIVLDRVDLWTLR